MAKITKQLTPIYHNISYRTEFRMDSENLKYSNLRLSGIYLYDGNGRIQNTSNGGVTEYIQSITLLSGNIQIDRCDNVQLLGCHRENSVKNRYNRYITAYTSQTLYSSSVSNTLPEPAQSLITQNPSLQDPYLLNGLEGYLPLEEYLLFLKATPVFKIPDTRIIIEWSNRAKLATGTLEPYLIYEEAVGENQAEFNGVSYNSWELDRFAIPEVDDGVQQSIKYRFQGFNGKRVNRFLIAFTPMNITTPRQALLCSPPQKAEQYQIYWNNIPIYPLEIDENLKSRLLLDSWGNKTQPFGQDLFNMEFYPQLVSNDYLSHTQSWAGVDMQLLPITNLQLSYKRVGFNNDPQPPTGIDQLKIFFFGEVLKQLSFNAKGQAVITYL